MNLQVTRFLLQKEKSICANHGYNVVDKYLGGGATGRVFLARPSTEKIRSTEKLKLVQKENKQLEVAIKICYADVGVGSISNLWKCLPVEIANCNKCFGLPNIVNLLDVFVSCKRIFMVMEFAAKGDLRKTFKEKISQQPKVKSYLEEEVARHYFCGIAKGVQQLHSSNIAHRDLKLENILITGEGQVKVCDLGLSVDASTKHKIPQDLLTHTHCGTRGFVAPEVTNGRKTPYNPFKADIWSIGVILFKLTNGYLPFEGKTSKEVYKKIIDSEGQTLPFREGLSFDCKALLNRMLERSSKLRPTIYEVVNDQWLAQNNSQSKVLPSNTQCLRNISGNSVYKFQSTFVRNYLWQRKKLLDDRRRFLLNSGNKSEDLRDAGILIRLPRKDTGGMNVNEVWRFEANELRIAVFHPDHYERKHNPNIEALKEPWVWSPDVEDLTLGIRCVERVITDLPMLNEWAAFLESDIKPRGLFEHCLIYCNTVDLAEKSLNLKNPNKTYCEQRKKDYEKEEKFAFVRQNILGFYVQGKYTDSIEDVLSKNVTRQEKLYNPSHGDDASNDLLTKTQFQGQREACNPGYQNDQMDICKTKKEAHITDEKLYLPTGKAENISKKKNNCSGGEKIQNEVLSISKNLDIKNHPNPKYKGSKNSFEQKNSEVFIYSKKEIQVGLEQLAQERHVLKCSCESGRILPENSNLNKNAKLNKLQKRTNTNITNKQPVCHKKHLDVEINKKERIASQSKLLKNLKAVDMRKLKDIGKIVDPERTDALQPALNLQGTFCAFSPKKIKEHFARSRQGCPTLRDSLFSNILQPRVAHASPKKRSMRSHNHNSARVTEQPASEIELNDSISTFMKDSAENAGETNLKNKERKSNLDMPNNATENAHKPPKIPVVFHPNCSPGKTNAHLVPTKLLQKKDNCHNGQGEIEKVEVESVPTYQNNPSSLPSPPEANKEELKCQPPKIADVPEDTTSSNIIFRRYGRILRQRIPNESDRFENNKIALTPVRPKEKKPDKLRNPVMARSIKRKQHN